MARTPQDITDAELAVLQVLWDGGTATIGRVTDALYPGGNAAKYATVQKLLDRLEAKECVVREDVGGVNTFTAAIGRADLIGRRLQTVAEKLCGGSWTPLLTHLVRNQKLNTRERQELRALIEELDNQQNRKGRR